MEIHTEIEFKSMLTEEEYTRILDAFPFTTYRQKNEYLDTIDYQFSQQKKGCRIRTKNSTFELTIKTPITQDETEEQNWILTDDQYHQFRQTRDLSHINPLFSQPLITIGTVETIRSEAAYKSGVLMIDHSIYEFHEDYEVEFEVTDPKQGKAEFEHFLHEFKLPYRPAEKKLVRMKTSGKR